MKLKLKPFTEKHALEVCEWNYKNEYSIYNHPTYSRALKEKWAITFEEKRKKEFFSVIDSYNKFLGYVRLQNKSNYTLIGIALKPEICGQGFGVKVLELLKIKCKLLYPKSDIILEVRDFNLRAIKCYKKAGFIEIDSYSKNTTIGFGNFIKMKLLTNTP